MISTTIVIPCYNEAERLNLQAFRDFAARHRDIRFLFCNDGSRDATPAMLDGLHAESPDRFGVHHLERNSGKAEAVRQGMLKAIEQGASMVGFWDADLATPLDAIPEFRDLLAARGDLEMVFGARVKLLGRQIERQPMRHYLGRVFATVASRMLRLPIYDTQCGAKLFRVHPEFITLVRQPFLSRWIFDVEIIARLIRARRGTDRPQACDVIHELPLQVWRDVKGSKLKGRDFIVVGKDLIRIQRTYLSR
jgi:dolichyl-phosphate beta-glucosyltransferase